MAKNHAARKAAKAQRRNAVVGARRKQEIATNSVSARLNATSVLPVRHCLVSDGLFENGTGTIALVRGPGVGQQAMAIFLLDTLALGVKDIIMDWGGHEEVNHMLEGMQENDPMSPISPEAALKLLDQLVQWAEDQGFHPHPDFGRATYLFGATEPGECETDYRPRFGRDGAAVYIPGPSDTPAQVRRRLAIVEQRQGEAGVISTIAAMTELAFEAGLLTEEDVMQAAAEITGEDVVDCEEMLRAEGLLDDEHDELDHGGPEIEGESAERGRVIQAAAPDRPA